MPILEILLFLSRKYWVYCFPFAAVLSLILLDKQKFNMWHWLDTLSWVMRFDWGCPIIDLSSSTIATLPCETLLLCGEFESAASYHGNEKLSYAFGANLTSSKNAWHMTHTSPHHQKRCLQECKLATCLGGDGKEQNQMLSVLTSVYNTDSQLKYLLRYSYDLLG